MSKPLYIPVNENENHWILVIAFPKAKLVVSCDPLKTDFKRKVPEINVFKELVQLFLFYFMEEVGREECSKLK